MGLIEFFVEDDYDLIEKVKIPDGQNNKRLKFIRSHVVKELGQDWVKFMQKSVIPLDIIFNLVMPYAAYHYIMFIHEVDWYNPLSVLFHTCFAGWAVLLQAGCYHDLTHRMPFGMFWTRFWAKMMVPQGGMGEAFYKRHTHHHNLTAELNDPKMRRFWSCSSDSWIRLFSLICPPYMVAMETSYQFWSARKWSDKIKVNYFTVKLENALRLVHYIAWMYVWGVWGGLLRFCSMMTGLIYMNSLRMITEHAGQDHQDDLLQATFYESGLFLRILFFGVPQGDLHHVHHVYPKIPNYKMVVWGADMNKVMYKLGVKKYTSLTGLIYDYFVAYKPYGTSWHEEEPKKID